MNARYEEVVEKNVIRVQIPYSERVKRKWKMYENIVPYSALELWGLVGVVLDSRTTRQEQMTLTDAFGPAGHILTHYRNLLVTVVDRDPDWIVGDHYIGRLTDVLQLCRLYVVAHIENANLAERLLGELDAAMWNIAPGFEFNKNTPGLYLVAAYTLGDWNSRPVVRMVGTSWEEYFETDGSVEDELSRNIFPTFRFGKKCMETFTAPPTSPQPEALAHNQKLAPPPEVV